jgi:cysteinyl-tRNA synthetase
MSILDTSYIRSWDDFVDALGSMPAWAQYRAQLRVQEMVKTAEQLAQYGVSYPHRYFGIREEPR